MRYKEAIERIFVIAALVFFSAAAALAQAEAPKHRNADQVAKLDQNSCADGFSFVVFSDIHSNETIFPVMRDAAAAMKPDFAIATGDMTNNGTQEEYSQFIANIETTGIPWFVAPGNHEYRTPDGHISSDGKKRFEKIFGKMDFSFTHCGWKFIGLDVVALDNLLPGQLRYIEKELKGYEGRAVVYMHYPPAVIEKWFEGYWKMNGKEFLALLEKYKAQYFFSGHLHEFDRLRLGPTAYIVTGGGGGGLDKSYTDSDKRYAADGGPFHHFIFVNVKDDVAKDFVVKPNLD